MIWDIALNYDRFRFVWQKALEASELRPFLFPPTETLDLGAMSRTYRTGILLSPPRSAGLFTVSAELTWTWQALHSARTATTEEDLLEEVLGSMGRDEETEQPWLRVDIRLHATLPDDAPLPLPPALVWRRWMADVKNRLGHLLSTTHQRDEAGELAVLAYQGEPEARVQCSPDGALLLTAVELSAWQGIDLPRHWDNPGRPADDYPDHQLADMADRVWRALQAWQLSLAYLEEE